MTAQFSKVCSSLLILAAMLLLPVGARGDQSSIIYVNGAAAAGGDGTSWVKARKTIREALDGATPGAQIRVARGTYATNNATSLTLKSQVALYGGFRGTETSLSERNPKLYPSIIDATPPASGLAAPHAVTLDRVAGVTLDGFTIRGGLATAAYTGGGGIYCNQVDQASVIRNCVITSNSATLADGAGLCLINSAVRVTSCVITNNAIASGPVSKRGGGLYVQGGAPVFSACVISDNSAPYGGGFYGDNTTLTLTLCTVSGNSASIGGGLDLDRGSALLSQSQILGNRALRYGGAIASSRTALSLSACTLSANGAIGAASEPPFYGGGLTARTGSLALLNCIVSGNYVLQGTSPGSGLCLYGNKASLTNCTIQQNVSAEQSGIAAQAMTALRITGSILSLRDQAQLAGTAELTNCLFYANTDFTAAQGAGNIIGNAQFAQSLAGFWTAAPQYDGRRNRTTLAAANAAFTPGALAGRLINPDAARGAQALVTSNTATLIQVAGDATSLTARNSLFQLAEARPGYASAALDAITTGPATDIFGSARPVDLPGVGANGTGTEFDIGAIEVQAAARPAIQVMAGGGTLDFGSRDPDGGPSAPLTLAVRNGGFSALSFSGAGFRISGPNAAAFAFAATPDLAALAPGERRDVGIRFDPSAVGPHLAFLTITTNDPLTPSITVALLGQGAYVAPVMAAEPAYTPGNTNTVAWSAAKGARGYTVQCGAGTGAGSGLLSSADLSSLTLKNTFTGLADRATYWYRVRATYGGGLFSDWSAPTTSTQDATLPAVSDFAVSPHVAADNQAVTITFTANKRVTNLAVTVNGHPATLVRFTDGGELADQHYVFSFTLPASDAPGLVRIAIAGTDHFGNALAFADSSALVKAGILFVDARAAAGGSGASWATAFRTVGAALAAAGQGNAIWVAAGRYSESVWLKSGVSLYGGFQGGETALEQRDPRLNQTWLDASHAAAGGWPAEHALGFAGCSNAAADGFWITGAQPDAYSSAGGAVYFTNSDASCTLGRCVVTGNTAAGILGGGILVERSAPRITSCTVVNNAALDAAGGGVAFDQCLVQASLPVLDRCLIAGNSAAVGGGLYANGSAVRLVNCALTGNTADSGAACYFENASGLRALKTSPLVNCTIDDNAAALDGGFCVSSGIKAALTNVAFGNNAGYAIYDRDGSNALTFVHCLFHGSAKGVYRAAATTETLTSAQLNTRLAGSSGNLDGDPNLLTGIGGQWAAAPAFDAATTRTTLQAAGTPFAPATLAGRVIDLYGDMHTLAVVTSNTASRVQVTGDARALTRAGAPFQLLDLRPGCGSAALDAGTASGAPATDLLGTPRPIDIPGVGADGTGTEFDIGAAEGQAIAGPCLVVSAAGGKLDFGGLLPGIAKSATRAVTMRNLGSAPLSFTGAGIALSGPAAADFTFSATPDITPLAAGASRVLNIAFSPSSAGLRAATLTLTTGDPALPRLDLALSGYRSLAAPVMAAEPALTSTTANTVAWTAVAQAHHYTAQCAAAPDFSSPVTLDNLGAPGCTFTGLTQSRLYYYRARAVDSSGLPGPWSNTAASTQDPVPPRVTISANAPAVTLAHTITFTLHFSEAIRPLSVADLALIGTFSASSVDLSLAGSGQDYAVTAWVSAPLASGTLGIRLGERVRDLAGNPLGDTASGLFQVKAPATVVVRPAPAAGCSWALTGPNYFSASGSGEQTVTAGWAGSYTIQWSPASGYAAEPSQTFAVAEGQTVILNKVLVPTAAGPVRDRALVVRYLLGLTTNATGLDANGDAKVDVLDLLYQEGRFAPDVPALLTPASGASGVKFTDTLTWTACKYAATYDLYMWKDGTTTATKPVVTGLATTSCVFPAKSLAGGAAYNMRYRWFVMARNLRAQTASPSRVLATEANPLQVVSPNGGESLKLGTTAAVHWKINTARAGKQVRLELWRSGAATRACNFGLFTTTTGDTTSNVKTTTTLTAAKDYKIRVISTQMEKAGELIPYDESDKTFELKK